MAVDHCTTECIGLHAAKRGTRFEALEPIRQGVRERFGGIGDGAARGLRLRHDHGSNYLADDFQQEVAFFGIDSSPSFVREPEGNGVAERFIRTLKENLLWVRSFETIEELRLALLAFKRTYNEQWMLEKYDYRSPAQVPTRPRRAGRGSVEANTVKTTVQELWGATCEIAELFAARGDDVVGVLRAANKLRQQINGDEVTYVVNRNINYTNVCYFRCKFCAFSKGKLSENLRGFSL